MSARPSKHRTYITRDEAARAAAAPPAPTLRPGVLRTIDVLLSPAVTGVAEERWRTLWWKTPQAALRIVLAFLDRRAEQVRLRAIERPPCVEIHGGKPDGAARLLAVIFDAPPAAVLSAHAAMLDPKRSAA
ncbi:hypothetical protein [Brevundimonas naejangsanensis]|uniref:hypothetical protein n=1 Tax=Brevundimonas naejangsanensis TaxID=588932 RepID=UPI0026EF889D|nr:hypothetical protein [Brevundimonas naejangsanensis]